MNPPRIPDQRAIIDRRVIADVLAAEVAASGVAGARTQIVEHLRKALADGREEIARRLAENAQRRT